VGAFGNKFRKAREKKNLSLDDVSNVTKIGSRMLQAIEEERFDQLPGGVFNKGFIRAYAKHLGLNDEEAVNDYLLCLRQAQIDAHEVWQPPAAAPPRSAPEKSRAPESGKPQTSKSAAKPQAPAPQPVDELPELQLPRAEDIRPRRKNFSSSSDSQLPWGMIAAAAVVVILAAILWVRHSHKLKTAAASSSSAVVAQAAPTPVSAPASPAASSVHSTNSNSAPANSATHPAAATAPAAAGPGNHASSGAASDGTANPKNTNATNQETNQPSSQPSNQPSSYEKNDVTVRTFTKPAATSSESAPAPLTLVIRADETSWISVLADGQPVSQETLIAPAHASVRASHEIVAKVGNAAGVTFLWNGKEIPAAGAEAEVKTFVFDSTGMHEQAPTPPQ
jgi:cytoskeletal protein RodZ